MARGRPKKANEKKVIDWFSKKNHVIKFEDNEDSYCLTQKVIDASDFNKYPIESGDVVEVGFVNDDGDKKVGFLRKQTTNKKIKKEEVKSSSNDVEVRTVKILAVRKDKTAIKIEDDTWPQVKENLQGHEALKAGNEIIVKILNGVIVGIKADSVKKEEPKEELKSTSTKKGNSIDNQSAVKSVAEIIKALIDKGVISTITEAESALIKLATTAKQLIVE
ncbi:MAG: hypothetical protein ACTSWG_13150 [Candidatus Helarchaeota archaeon]